MMLKASSHHLTHQHVSVANASHLSRFNSICLTCALLLCLCLSFNYISSYLFACRFGAGVDTPAPVAAEFRRLLARKRSLECLNTFYRLHELHRQAGQRSPVRVPVSVDAFEAAGLPIHYYWFVEHNYLDLLKSGDRATRVSARAIADYQALIVNNSINYNPYNDVYLEKMLRTHLTSGSPSVVVLGNYEREYAPWIEALLLLIQPGAEVKVVDYGRKFYENSAVRWTQTADFFSSLIDRTLQPLDVVVSHLAVEQIGLGRFGEPVAPDADLDTLRGLHCALRPDGLLFLTLSASKLPDKEPARAGRTKSYVEFNVRRVYGDDRVDELVRSGPWRLVDEVVFNFGSDRVLVLQKLSPQT